MKSSDLAGLTPLEIVSELDRYVIGQAKAKKAVAIALRNRWRRQRVKGEMQAEIMPNNIIMIGPTGVGKTEIARRLAKLSNAPFVKVEATKYTEVGYVGRDVETMIRDLTEVSLAIVRSEQSERIADLARAAAEQTIVESLIRTQSQTSTITASADIEQVEHARNTMSSALRNGLLDEREVEVDVQAESPIPGLNIMGPFGGDSVDLQVGEMLQSFMPKRIKKRRMKVKEALQILQQQEAEKRIDMESVTREAVWRAENLGIVFIDEIDKVASSGPSGSDSAGVSREGVQRDLLPIVEGSTVNTKYGPVRTDHVLFIASGAFHTSKPSDLIPELQGRFPIRVELESLTESDFVQILTIPDHALIKQYTALLSADGVDLSISDEAIREIASAAARVNDSVANIGARRLHTIMSMLLEDVLFDFPKEGGRFAIELTAEMVRSRLRDVVADPSISKYVL